MMSTPTSNDSVHSHSLTIRNAMPSPELRPLLQTDAGTRARRSIEKTDNQQALPGYSPSVHSDDIWVTASEDMQPPNSTPAIRLEPGQDEEGDIAQSHPPWYTRVSNIRYVRLPSTPNINVPPENRGFVDEITRGFMILVTTPIAFIGMVLYATGMIIEGIALMMKGAGSLGTRILMKRRTGQSSEPAWV